MCLNAPLVICHKSYIFHHTHRSHSLAPFRPIAVIYNVTPETFTSQYYVYTNHFFCLGLLTLYNPSWLTTAGVTLLFYFSITFIIILASLFLLHIKVQLRLACKLHQLFISLKHSPDLYSKFGGYRAVLLQRHSADGPRQTLRLPCDLSFSSLHSTIRLIPMWLICVDFNAAWVRLFS